MNIQDVVKKFMGKKITKEGNSKFWGTDDLHEHCDTVSSRTANNPGTLPESRLSGSQGVDSLEPDTRSVALALRKYFLRMHHA